MRELRALPPGRYALIPAGEARDEGENEDEDVELTPEQIAGLDEALGRFERGEPAVSAEASRSRTQAVLESTAPRRK